MSVTVSEYIKAHPYIIREDGINWSDLYLLTEEDVAAIKTLFCTKQPSVSGPWIGLTGVDFAHAVGLRSWFQRGPMPGTRERDWFIKCITDAQATGARTGIAPTAYPELLSKLRAMPDSPDSRCYYVHIHM